MMHQMNFSNPPSSRDNRRVKSRPKRLHRKLSLPPPRHSRHLLLSILVLPRQVQQAHSHGSFIADSFRSFSAVHLPGMQMGINIVTHIHLSHLGSFPINVSLCSHREYTYLISQPPRSSMLCREAPILMSSSRWKHILAVNPGAALLVHYSSRLHLFFGYLMI
ncbi:hypothetical protein EV702DRAFT_355800 [Suillus placidus]|uniref:Uncharacterized protein n=1 Tax=Suillus placidus TaxID=48579 RepID=A0A9P6ZTY4_9AGAM|nr:hypothetical protein EV702DRAFT_355800 [Suillus placidus]